MNMHQTRTVSDFYESDGINFASYDNLRKLPNYIDGLKISQRKLLCSGFKHANKDYHKTEPFCNIVATEQCYIHGPQNLIGIASLMAAQYKGSNNYSLFIGNDSGFGSFINPAYASGRYTKIRVSDVSKRLFFESDMNILEKQFFEGQYIEPKFLVPVFPCIFLNSSEGLSTGFASSIFSRNPKEIIEYIKKRLSGVEKPRMPLLPWFKNHAGRVEYNAELGKTESFGVIVKNNMNSYTVTELPIGTGYKKYTEILDKLVESGIIQDYEDKCDPKTDSVVFEVKTSREFTRKHESERSLYEAFKLVRSLPETLCCIDENNRVREFGSVREILDSFIELRLKYYGMRKEYLLKTLKSELERLVSKWLFIKGMVDGTIVISKKTRDQVDAQLGKVDGITKVDGSYSYLTSMPLHSLTKERIEELRQQIENKKKTFEKTKNATVEQMWTDDLDEFAKELKL